MSKFGLREWARERVHRGAVVARRAAQLVRTGNRHGLDAPLVLSLTSFPPRFGTLSLTLDCLATQSIKPDHIVLWIAHGDRDLIPAAIRKRLKGNVELRLCRDLRSFKKIVPLLQTEPNTYVVTADDDLHYSRSWLEDLLRRHEEIGSVVCHRAHLISLQNGRPVDYLHWELETSQSVASDLLFPTTGAGVLYPPDSFDPEVVNENLFARLCPDADDVWLYWMMRLRGKVAARVSNRSKLISWRGSQSISLADRNFAAGGNDRQIEAMLSHFGPGIFEQC